jgi:GAF domain-containing protein
VQCPRCEQENPPGSNFCPGCGTRLDPDLKEMRIGRRAKPAKEKVQRTRRPARSRKADDGRIRELEKRLAERLKREPAQDRVLADALEQQSTTADILRIIASSPNDLPMVLHAVAERAARLCEAADVLIHRVDGAMLPIAAGAGSFAATYSANDMFPLVRSSVAGRAVLDRKTIHVHDLAMQPDEEFAVAKEYQRRYGHRTVLSTPLMRAGTPIGAIWIRRTEVRPFTDKQIKLLETFADQAVIAIENVRLFTELQASNHDLAESLNRETATADILEAISRSPTDTQPVFEAIAESAIRLFRAWTATVFRLEGELLHPLAARGGLPGSGTAVQYRESQRVTRDFASGRCIVDRSIVHIADVETDPDAPARTREIAAARGFRAALCVPLLRDSQPIGTIAVSRAAPGRFSDGEISLLQTFADQAVIAIENVRLFTELEARNHELRVSLEQQTATSELLKVIGHSTFDLQPVFATLAENAVRLCEADYASIWRFDGQWMRAVATSNVTAERKAYIEQNPIPLGRSSAVGRAAIERRTIHIHDAQTDPEYTYGSVPQDPLRTVLAVPMLRTTELLGVIFIHRPEVRPFADGQIALIQTFADQAAIAIENVRLFNETKEALEQQTATGEILRVIAGSPTDVQPVFDAIVRMGARLCEADYALLARYDGTSISVAAHSGATEEEIEAVGQVYPMGPTPETLGGRTILERAVVHISDVSSDPTYGPRVIKDAGWRTGLGVPLLREGAAIGALGMWRRAVRPFSDRQITLLQTFANQAVIAIENVRLFKELDARTQELTRSVGELRALGEVGEAISSTLDLQTVLSTIVARATQLSGTDAGVIYEYDAEREIFVPRATEHLEVEIVETMLSTPVRKGEGATGQLAQVHEPIQLPDVLVAPAESRVRGTLVAAGYRALLAVPLLREGALLGGLTVIRKTPGEFAPEIVELLRTFATQSALAIQNARLFQEIEAKGRELQVGSQHKSEFLASMSHELRTPLNAIIGYSELLEEEAGDLDGGRLVPDLQKIAVAAKHQLSLINDILDLSKVEAGRMELEVAHFDLSTAIDNALTLVRERAMRRGITLGSAVDGAIGAIRADERKIKQVLLNLLSNALKFTPEGGQVDVHATRTEGSIEVAVSDTGVGIAPEDQEAVFEEFRQVGVADRKVEGTGLGLALCRKFIELHGGRIWVKSEVGQGSTFTFTLPIRSDGQRGRDQAGGASH